MKLIFRSYECVLLRKKIHLIRMKLTIRVSTEFRVDGIPYTVFTVVFSVCYKELQKIPWNYTEFRVKDRVSTEVTFGILRKTVILCESDFHAEFRGIMFGYSAEFRGMQVTSA
jgi:hypothetical protein